jgi:hypothetical protein
MSGLAKLADPTSPDEQERLLAATVTLFPQTNKILERIVADTPVKEKRVNGVKWYESTIVLDRLVDAGVVVVDETRKCGYRAIYHYVFTDFSKQPNRGILAKGATMMAERIEQTITPSDSTDNTMFASFENVFNIVGHREFLAAVYSLLCSLRDKSQASTDDDSVLSFSLSAKIRPLNEEDEDSNG